VERPQIDNQRAGGMKQDAGGRRIQKRSHAAHGSARPDRLTTPERRQKLAQQRMRP